jgi:hypothetical protein
MSSHLREVARRVAHSVPILRPPEHVIARTAAVGRATVEAVIAVTARHASVVGWFWPWAVPPLEDLRPNSGPQLFTGFHFSEILFMI